MPLKLNPDELPTINLTSMIDVVFLLLIFFMVGTRFSDAERNLPVELPKVSAPGSTSRTNLTKTINLYRDGGIEFENQRMNLTDVTRNLSILTRNQSQIDVIIRADGQLPIQRVTEVMVAVRRLGIQRIAINDSSNLSR